MIIMRLKVSQFFMILILIQIAEKDVENICFLVISVFCLFHSVFRSFRIWGKNSYFVGQVEKNVFHLILFEL